MNVISSFRCVSVLFPFFDFRFEFYNFFIFGFDLRSLFFDFHFTIFLIFGYDYLLSNFCSSISFSDFLFSVPLIFVLIISVLYNLVFRYSISLSCFFILLFF